jgi:hypothetical protein
VDLSNRTLGRFTEVNLDPFDQISVFIWREAVIRNEFVPDVTFTRQGYVYRRKPNRSGWMIVQVDSGARPGEVARTDTPCRSNINVPSAAL